MSTYWYNTSTSTTSTTSTASAISLTFTDNIPLHNSGTGVYIDIPISQSSKNIKVSNGAILELPDGALIEVDDNGNYEIIDDNAKIIYKANRTREFNKFMNASDLLEDFINDLGKAKIRQGEVLNIPIEMFINWIIHKSAEQDGDDIPNDIPALTDSKYKHIKCKQCGRFLKKELINKGLLFCNGSHYQKYMDRL